MSISRMIYFDDSGSVASGLIVFAWIECSPERWRYALRELLEMRKALFRNHSVAPSEELHATKFINGRGRISTGLDSSEETEWKTLGRAVALACLAVLAGCDDIRIGAVYRRTSATGRAYYLEKGEVYKEVVHLLNRQHREEGTYALLGMDGNGTDPIYVDAHRSLALDDRHIIEDPIFHDSHKSQWVQMADLVAYVIFCHLNRDTSKTFAWGWYDEYLASKNCYQDLLLI